jgi:beta-lactamase superfamily II metal-dependent hydrolase
MLLLPWVIGSTAFAGDPAKPLDVYFIDTEGGAATLIVTPQGESLLADTGNPGERDAGRIAKVAKEAAGLQQIDHVITTHFHLDHVGGLPRLSELIPVKRFYDHGIPTPLLADIRPQDLEAYRKTTGGTSTALKPGDEIPLRSSAGSPPLKLRVVASDGLVLGEKGASAQERPCEKGHQAAAVDSSDNARSIAFVLSFGGFRLFDGGDLTWNTEHKLVCPENIPGEVDVYQVNHHGLDQSNNPALVEALRPRVAIMNNGARKGGEPKTFATLKGAIGLEAVFQLHRSVRLTEKENSPSAFVANDEETCKGEYIKLSVDPTGKSYTVTVPSKGTTKRYETKKQQ